MKVSKIEIENFRLLDSIEINLEDITTAIVGKNNSGKTSFSEIFNIFMNKNRFEFEDFSINSHSDFQSAYDIFLTVDETNKEEKIAEIIQVIPKIKLLLSIRYTEEDNWVNIKPFLTSLSDSNEIKILFEYLPKDSEKFIQGIHTAIEANESMLVNEIKTHFSNHYQMVIKPYSETETTSAVDINSVKKLLQCHFIEAQRNLEDSSPNNTKLSSIFQKQYDYKTRKEDNSSDDLIEATSHANEQIEVKLKDFFKEFVDSFQEFGFPGLDREQLELESNLEIENLFKNNVRLVYNHNDNKLPEKYNGLGYKNLMYIISKILSFEILYQDNRCDLNLLFIEEPEAHMHPQMQSVFIKNITSFLESKQFNVQVVISTHSSHILTNAEFESIRYFTKNSYCSEVKDLRYFHAELEEDDTLKFLEQYLTLDKGELFFSDKAILFEGVVERLLMPIFIKKVEQEDVDINLSEQYISYIEVGGAYMNKFKELLKFLDIKTLIITDIDSIDPNNSRKAVEITDNENYETSNACLRNWLPEKTKILELLSVSSNDKTDENIRVAYQTKIDSDEIKCGRSFEESFLLDNLQFLFEKKDNFTSFTKKLSQQTNIQEVKQNSYEITEGIKKTDFAFDLLSNQDEWIVPRYIQEGLKWLSQH